MKDVPGSRRKDVLTRLCDKVQYYTDAERDAVETKTLSSDLPRNIKEFILALIDRPCPALSLSSPSDRSTKEPAPIPAAQVVHQ